MGLGYTGNNVKKTQNNHTDYCDFLFVSKLFFLQSLG